MHDHRFKPILIALLAFLAVPAPAQSRSTHEATAEGSLTVTAVVNSSVGFMRTPDGRQLLIIANAPDPKETFFLSCAAEKDSHAALIDTVLFTQIPFELAKQTRSLTTSARVQPECNESPQ